MEAIALAFFFTFWLRYCLESLKEDYNKSGNAYRRMAPGASKARSPGRYTTGYTLYQLRHGWPSMRRDAGEGWQEAKRQHNDWQRTAGKSGPGAAFRAGWRRAARKADDATGGGKPRNPQGAASKGRHAKAESNGKPSATSKPGAGGNTSGNGSAPAGASRPSSPAQPNPASNGDSTSMTTSSAPSTPGEAGSISVYRAHNQRAIQIATQRIEAAQQEIQAADQEIAAHENVHNDLQSQGVGQQAAAGMADLVEAAQQRRGAAQQMLQQAEQAKAAAEQNLAGLDKGGHTSTEESVKSMSDKPAQVEWYQG